MASIFQVAEQRVSADIKAIKDTLASNRVDDMEHYRFLTGQLKGLTTALQHFKDLEVQVNNDEDWED